MYREAARYKTVMGTGINMLVEPSIARLQEILGAPYERDHATEVRYILSGSCGGADGRLALFHENPEMLRRLCGWLLHQSQGEQCASTERDEIGYAAELVVNSVSLEDALSAGTIPLVVGLICHGDPEHASPVYWPVFKYRIFSNGLAHLLSQVIIEIEPYSKNLLGAVYGLQFYREQAWRLESIPLLRARLGDFWYERELISRVLERIDEDADAVTNLLSDAKSDPARRYVAGRTTGQTHEEALQAAADQGHWTDTIEDSIAKVEMELGAIPFPRTRGNDGWRRWWADASEGYTRLPGETEAEHWLRRLESWVEVKRADPSLWNRIIVRSYTPRPVE